MTHVTEPADLSWLVDDLVVFPGILSAVVFSSDGLIIQKSTNLPQPAADILSAAASSLHSVAGGLGRRLHSGTVHQVIVEYDGQMLFVAAAGENTRLAVMCERNADMGAVAYQMSSLVTRLREPFSAAVRPQMRAQGHD